PFLKNQWLYFLQHDRARQKDYQELLYSSMCSLPVTKYPEQYPAQLQYFVILAVWTKQRSSFPTRVGKDDRQADQYFYFAPFVYAGCSTPIFITCLTCTLLPWSRSGQPFESSTASSISFALMIKKPPTTSLPSV